MSNAALVILGRAVREIREEQGLSVGELAERAGISRRRVEAIEGGRHDPVVEVLFALGRGLGVGATALLGRCEDLENRAQEGA